MAGKWMAIAGALLAATGVGLGAFGAHGLEDQLRQLGHVETLAKRLAWFDTAVRYQLYHALGMIVVAALAAGQASGLYRAAAWLFVVGIALFSGSLYAMTFAGDAWKKLGMVTPLGGLAFIVGWVLVAMAAAKRCWWRRVYPLHPPSPTLPSRGREPEDFKNVKRPERRFPNDAPAPGI